MISRFEDKMALVIGGAAGAGAATARQSRKKSGRLGASCTRNVLLSREKRLLEMAQGLRRTDEELSADLPADRLDRAANLEQQEIVDGLRSVEVRELREIGAALQRLDAGTYGVCESCGEPVDALRLHALPATRTCTQCMGSGRRQTSSLG